MFKLHHISLGLVLLSSVSSFVFLIGTSIFEKNKPRLSGEIDVSSVLLKSFPSETKHVVQHLYTDIEQVVPVSLIKKAHTDKSGKHAYFVAHIYKDGLNKIRVDREKYAEWMSLSLSREYEGALYDRALLLKEKFGFFEHQEALSLLARAAKKDHPLSQFELGIAYYDGVLVERDCGAARYWFTKASKAGIAEADYALGVIYHLGCGVEPSPGRAMNYYRLAANQGHPMALYILALGYYSGTGVEKDYQVSRDLLNRAILGGSKEALEMQKLMNLV